MKQSRQGSIGIALGNRVVTVRAAADLTRAVIDYVGPYFEVVEAPDLPDATVAINLHSSGLRMASPLVAMLPYFDAGDQPNRTGGIERFNRPFTGVLVTLDPAARLVTLDGENATELLIQSVLVLRDQLLRQLAKADGFVECHAAAGVLGDGTGVAIMGGAHAGKTTTLLNLLYYQQCHFVSSDRVWLRAGSEIEMRGIPSRCNVHRATIETHPMFAHIEDRRPIMYGISNKTLIDRALLTGLSGCSVVPTTTLSLLLLPTVDPHRGGAAEVTLVDDPTVSRTAVMENVFGSGVEDTHVEWLGMFPNQAVASDEAVGRLAKAAERVRAVRLVGSHKAITEAVADRKLFERLTVAPYG